MKKLTLVAAISLLVALFAMPATTHAAGSQQLTRTFEASTNVAVAGEGDGNGFEITPADAYVDDNTNYAVDTNSGAKDNATATGTGTDKHNYGGFGMDTIPSTSGTINGITVRADIAVNALTNAPFTAIRLSWDGGTSWTTSVPQQTLDPITETTYTYGGTGDDWAHTWTGTDLEDGNFLVQVINGDTNVNVSNLDYSLDYIQVTVTFTPAWDSYSDTGRTTQPPGDTFSDSTNVVYMKGTSFYDGTQTYNVSYYDNSGAKIATDAGIAPVNVVGTRGDLGNTADPYEPTYGFTSNPGAAPGTWHIVVQPTGAAAFPSDYNALDVAPNTYDLIADDTCTVDGSAIPEFSTVMAAIGVAGMCFGVYWWMRKKYRRKMARAYVPN